MVITITDDTPPAFTHHRNLIGVDGYITSYQIDKIGKQLQVFCPPPRSTASSVMICQ
jgi:hypothetical protein